MKELTIFLTIILSVFLAQIKVKLSVVECQLIELNKNIKELSVVECQLVELNKNIKELSQ